MYPMFIGVSLPAVKSVELFHVTEQKPLPKGCPSEMYPPDLSRTVLLKERVGSLSEGPGFESQPG